ncbi:MAG TPA: RIP metalloprotease RseP [Erysipelothrix sp.]
MNFILNLIMFALVLGIIVMIHELGHLIAAKAFGVYCHEFAIGMGPKIASYKKPGGETKYSIRALPLGGYVAMAGEDVPADALDGVHVPLERTIDGIKPWKRLIVMLAGIFMNFVLAFLIFWGLLFAQGTVEPPAPIIESVQAGYPAEKAGLMAGDEIIKMTFFDGKSLVPETFNDVLMALTTYEDRAVTLTVKRGSDTLDLELQPEYLAEENRYIIGVIIPQGKVRELGLFEAAGTSVLQIKMIISQFFFLITRLVRGIGLDNVGGPIGIFEVTSQVRTQGFVFFLSLVAMLSVNLGVVNILPIPVMDGGRALLTIIEMILGRPINKKLENFIMNIGMMLLFALFIFIMYNDIRKKF